MKRTILTLALCIITIATYASDSLIVSRAVYFDVDQYQLTPIARQQLDSMVQSLRDQGECAVSIYGSTDIDGTAGYNQKLSERRAHAVQDYLLAQNIKAVKCMARGLGRKGDEFSKPENRRVDVELRFTYFSGVADLFQSLSKDADQNFQIDPQADNEIKCQNNTVINIPAGSLILPNGEKPKGKVSITVREAISTADILAQDLNSVSDGRMLETRGMVYIGASSGGQQLAVDPSSPISVTVPGTNASENDFKLFYGAKHGDQAMNWKVADKSFKPAVKTVPIALDRSMLSSMIYTGRMAPVAVKPSGDVPVPVMPSKPRMPIELQEPQRGDLYKASALERAFYKRKIAMKNEELYQQEVHKYDMSLEKQRIYKARMKDYEKAINTYNEQMNAFKREGEYRMALARQFFKARYEYLATGNINKLIKTIEAAPINNKTVLTGYANSWLFHNDQDQRELLKQILGETYFHYYHYDDPKTEIRDIGDNISITKTDCIYPTFRVEGYTGIYDSLLRVTHLGDTLAMLQDRITQRCMELGLFSQKNVDGYVASVNQLGWINCDRFNETPKNQLVRMTVKEQEDVRMYMVFTDIKSCMPMGRLDNAYISNLVPTGKTVRIVAVKVVEGKPQLAVSTINTASRIPLVLQYKTCSLTDIRSNFAAL
jgi:hypothetical protein